MSTLAGSIDNRSLNVRRVERSVVADFGRRVMRTRLAPIGIAMLFLLILCAAFAGTIAPYDPTYQDYSTTN